MCCGVRGFTLLHCGIKIWCNFEYIFRFSPFSLTPLFVEFFTKDVIFISFFLTEKFPFPPPPHLVSLFLFSHFVQSLHHQVKILKFLFSRAASDLRTKTDLRGCPLLRPGPRFQTKNILLRKRSVFECCSVHYSAV